MMKIQKLATCCRSRRCLFSILLIISLFFTFILNVFLRIRKKSCSKTEEKRIIADLCHSYHAGLFTGSLCPHLCDSKSIRPQTCLSGGASKTVILGSWDGTTIVLKSRQRDDDDLQPLTIWETGDDGQRAPRAPEVGMFETMVHGEVASLLSVDIAEGKELLVQMLSDGPYQPEETKPTLAFMNTLMTLVRQEEYVNFKYFRDSNFYPDVLGYCGNFYGVEYIPVDQMLSSISLSSYGSSGLGWEDRVQIALNLVDIVVSMEGRFEEGMERLHMCDMKAENFGVGEDLSVKIIDGDMMFSAAKMESIQESQDCSTDEDCDFFDCEGICDVRKRKCEKWRKNLNFQVLCRDILSTGIKGTRLLSSPPEEYKDKIREEVEQCSRLSGDGRVKEGWDPSRKLRELLRHSRGNM